MRDIERVDTGRTGRNVRLILLITVTLAVGFFVERMAVGLIADGNMQSGLSYMTMIGWAAVAVLLWLIWRIVYWWRVKSLEKHKELKASGRIVKVRRILLAGCILCLLGSAVTWSGVFGGMMMLALIGFWAYPGLALGIVGVGLYAWGLVGFLRTKLD